MWWREHPRLHMRHLSGHSAICYSTLHTLNLGCGMHCCVLCNSACSTAPETCAGCSAALLNCTEVQVYRASQMGYWRASKRWCKQLPSEAVSKALAIFANNEAGLQPSDVYGGPSGAIAQLQQLAAWFQVGWLHTLVPGVLLDSLAATFCCFGMHGGKLWGPPLCP